MAKVVTESNGATLHEGTVEDCEYFIERKFPRLHSEPGGADPKPDVILVSGTSKKYFNGAEFVSLGKGKENAS